MFMLLLSLHVVGGPIPAPARAPIHYKIVAKQTMDVDLSAVGQPPTNIVMMSSAYVSVTTSDTTGGKLVHFVIDSSTFDAGAMAAQLPPEFTASPNGTVYHVYVVNGVPLSQPVPTPAGIQASQLVPGIQLLLAGMHPTGTAGTWVDTTSLQSTTSGADAATTRITSWKSRPGDGGRMQSDGDWTGSATVGSAMTKMDMQMTGTAHVVAMPGALSETATSTGIGQANMNIAGSTIPIKVTMEVTASATP